MGRFVVCSSAAILSLASVLATFAQQVLKKRFFNSARLFEAGTLVLVFWLTTAIASPAQTFKSLVSFDGTDGRTVNAPVVQGIDGNLYGTTFSGGDHGTVFKITPGGVLTTLYTFCAQTNCTDGNWPQAGVVLGTDGNFYGTTFYGGTNSYCENDLSIAACGTVFKITPGGELTTLYSFCAQSNCADGDEPSARLVQGSDGNFYGTTSEGGASINCCGIIFKITPGGKLTTLYTFVCSGANCGDGEFPSGLVQATDGNFYGTTNGGGAIGDGTVFKITPEGTLTTLHSFGGTDGYGPEAGLVQASDGDLYGTTLYGGAYGWGTVFKITVAGALTTLYSFCAQTNCPDGSNASGVLVQATDGNFYGTAGAGGPITSACPTDQGECGTVFKVTPGGTLTTLHSFDSTDGWYPFAGVVQATNGSFYGTTENGGTNNDGTVFTLSMGLGPFVKTLPASGAVGAKVTILGNTLTGATKVTFNGTAATFTVVSSTQITTTVPTGATSGIVAVTTPGGVLKSNVAFQVAPATTWILRNSSQITELSSVSSHSCAPMNVTAGDLLLSYNIVYNGSTSGLALINSDSQGNAWKVIQTESIWDDSILQIEFAQASMSGSDTIEVRTSSNVNVHNIGNGCEEWSGGAASGAILDVSGAAKSSANGTVASASAVTTESNDLVVGFCVFPWDSGYSNFAMSAGAGYTQDVFNNFLQTTSVYQVAAGPGKQTASCTTSGPASTWSAIVAAFLGSGT